MRRLQVLVALLLAVSASSARADSVVVGDYVQILSGPHRVAGFSGGEFTVKSSTEEFVSFCLEYNEHITTGRSYYVGGINKSAVLGGPVNQASGADGKSDPLDPMTAYLYTQVRSGTYSLFYGTPGDPEYVAKAARALQRAIWFIEGEPYDQFSTNNVFYQDALAALAGRSAYFNGSWSGLGNVRVLNLYTDRTWDAQTQQWAYSGFAQDQITMVPEPGSLLLLGTGLVGFAFAVRRRARK